MYYYGAGVRVYNRDCGEIRNVVCPCCHGLTRFAKVRNVREGKILGIPIIRVTNYCAFVCPVCKTTFEAEKKNFSQVNDPAAALASIAERSEEKRVQQEQLYEKYSVGFSEKNQKVAVVLAALLTAYGAPFFYIGKPLIGMTLIVFSFACILLELFPLLQGIVLLGFIFAFLIACGKVKDKTGRYLVSETQRKLFSRNDKKD